MDCDHLWAFQSLVYWDGAQRSGSSACYRLYADRYFCQKCLEVKDLRKREIGTNFDKPLVGAVPK